ncbi:MAG: T9SS type A sorting domain-containing protein [Saprospiraceae bacterium]|nr:T9SS type A sorting domain-containing protein [Saprospiraceae bacterium]
MKNYTQFSLFSAILLLTSLQINGQNIRTIDGYDNNVLSRSWGSVGQNQIHVGTIGFADGMSEPAGSERPNERLISNVLFNQSELINDPRDLSAYCWAWGQFIDHDITLTHNHPDEAMEIGIPAGDAFFDPTNTGTKTMPMHRSVYDPATGHTPNRPRSFVNSVTAYIDGSAVYGSDLERAAWLRTFESGKLKVSSGDLLPWNTTTGEYDAEVDPNVPEMDIPFPFLQKWFVAGDIRANENPFLTSLHTLFVREHNRICDELKDKHADWTDEQLYQHARKLVGGQMQAIVYEEWLPAMGMQVPPYVTYNLFQDPSIMNVFSAAAFRYGHTTINSILVRMDNDGNYISQGDILLRDAYFNPGTIRNIGGIEPYLIGMATVVQQDFDCKVIDDLRNFLFGAPGSGGLDLAAINIARGRERGLPDYNSVRKDFGLKPIASFSELTNDPLTNQIFESTYASINDIDPWVGILSEPHMPDALFGKTAMTIVKRQFMALRDGDRFYYEHDGSLSAEEKNWLKETRLVDVVRRNSPISIVQDQIFLTQSYVTTATANQDQTIDFALYPNPTVDQVFLRVPAQSYQAATIRVIDMQGRVAMEEKTWLNAGNNTLSYRIPSNLAAGLYVLTVQSDGLTGQKRFMKGS